MLGGADNPNGELPSYITGANIPDIRPDASCFCLFSARNQNFYWCVVSVNLAGVHHVTVQGIIQWSH